MGEIIESGEEMSKLLNDYFLSVFNRENQDTIPLGKEVFRGEENDKLRDVIITRQVVQKEIEKLKKINRQVQTTYIHGFWKNAGKYLVVPWPMYLGSQ